MSDDRSDRWEETRSAWDAVGERFADVARQVSERYRSLEAESGEAADQAGRRVSEAVNDMVRQLDQAFTSVGDTLRDPQAKEGLAEAVRTFGQALETTFSDLAKRLRKPGS